MSAHADSVARFPRARVARWVAGGYLVVVAAVFVWVALVEFVLPAPPDASFAGIWLEVVTMPTWILLFPLTM